MRVRMRLTVLGTFHDNPAGVRAGDVVEIDDVEAQRYIGLGYAERLRDHPAEERAVASRVLEERAVVERAVVVPKVESVGDAELAEETPVKRGPGRPRKA